MRQAVDADALKPGTLAGAYVLKKELASGGGGTVYEAQHRILGRRAAVKVLRRQLAASPQMVARFVQEARAVNMIKHPSIVDIFEFDDLPDGRPFYVMELLEGIDLRSMLNERGRFPPGEVLEILEPVCSALQAAHDLGIVHRDLKASNIFIANGGRPARGQAARLRHREAAAPGRGRGRADRRRHAAGHVVHDGARADPRRRRRRAHRHLRAGRRALPPGHGAVPVPRRDDDRHRAPAPGGAAAAAQPGGAACRPRWTPSCCAAWRRPPSAATRPSRRSSRRCATRSAPSRRSPR